VPALDEQAHARNLVATVGYPSRTLAPPMSGGLLSRRDAAGEPLPVAEAEGKDSKEIVPLQRTSA
jgi:hypothetical protein